MSGPATTIQLAADLALPQECSNVALALLDRNDAVIFVQSFNELNTRIRYRETVTINQASFPLRWILVNLSTGTVLASQSSAGGSATITLASRSCVGSEDRVGAIVTAYHAERGSTSAPIVVVDEGKNYTNFWIAFAILLVITLIAIYFLYLKQNTLEPETVIQLRS